MLWGQRPDEFVLCMNQRHSSIGDPSRALPHICGHCGVAARKKISGNLGKGVNQPISELPPGICLGLSHSNAPTNHPNRTDSMSARDNFISCTWISKMGCGTLYYPPVPFSTMLPQTGPYRNCHRGRKVCKLEITRVCLCNWRVQLCDPPKCKYINYPQQWMKNFAH